MIARRRSALATVWSCILARCGLAALASLLVVPVAFAPSVAAQTAAKFGSTTAAAVNPDRLPAVGTGSVMVTIDAVGRYAIEASSGQGVALQLVDRMAGPGPILGRPGHQDGRIDVLLDRGTYRLITRGDANATGEVELRVKGFVERAMGDELLAALQPITTELGDVEQRSYWLTLTARETVMIEAAGRSLADLRLWHDGRWLVDAEPDLTVTTPTTGQPVRRAQLAADLEPGRYRVTAYGGPALAWATEGYDTGAPRAARLDLRYSIPVLAEAGRAGRTLGPFGADYFVVPGGATYFRLELPSPATASLSVGRFESRSPWRASRTSVARLTPKTALPVAELRAEANADRPYWVTVEGAAGQAYTLQHFAEGPRTIEGADGAYWVSTVHAGDPRDALTPTGLLVATAGRAAPRSVQAANVSATQGWTTLGNVRSLATFFLDVASAGHYVVLVDGVDTRVRIEPFLREKPRAYEPPPWQAPGAEFDLGSGLHLVSIEPIDATRVGAITVVVRSAGATSPTVDEAPEAAARAPGSVRLGSVRLEAQERYSVRLGQQGGVAAGTVVRPLPLELRRPLPMALVPGEPERLLIEHAQRGRLQIETENPVPLTVTVDDQPWSPGAWIEAGRHLLVVQSDGPSTEWSSLTWTPELPAVEPATPIVGDESTLLTEAAPYPFSLARGAARTFRVRADTPALYRLETTGLLATEGNLRTAVQTSLDRQRANGVGRNALLQTYLRAGDYQLTVRAQGASAGALGVRLTRAPVRAGGLLRDGIPARGRLVAGEAVAYDLDVPTDGTYAIRALALGRNLRVRLDDDDGWPVVAPGIEGDMTLPLAAGRYRLIVLPGDVDARHVALVERHPPPMARSGHGLHGLPFDERIEHRWHEPEDEGAPRAPDVWHFTLPAPVTVQIALTNEMQADLVRLGDVDGVARPADAAEVVGYVPPERGWTGALGAGTYALRVTCVRVNNRVDYQLRLTPDALFPGLARTLDVPAKIDVAVGTEGLVEISTFGEIDVRARLFDAEGHELARNDDRPGDWNALIARRLPAGRYRLEVEPAGGRDDEEASIGSTRVQVAAPVTTTAPALALTVATPEVRSLAVADEVLLVPLTVPAAADVLIVGARAHERVGVAIEQRQGAGWTTLAQRLGSVAEVVMPVPTGLDATSLRLRLWSLDRRGNPLMLDVEAVSAATLAESAWLTGASIPPTGKAWRVAAIALSRPGCFRVAEEGVLIATTPGQPAVQADGVVAAPGPVLWVARRASGPRRAWMGERLVLHPDGGGLNVTAPASGRAVCDLPLGGSDGPLIIEARSPAGAPGVASTPSNPATAPTPALAFAGRKAVTVAFPAAGEGVVVVPPSVALWSRTGNGSIEAHLSAQRFPDAVPEPAPWGDQALRLTAGEARAFDLPAGEKRLRLLLDRGLLAALVDPAGGDGAPVVASVHGGHDVRLDEWLDTAAAQLWLFGLESDAEARVNLKPLPGDAALRPPSPGVPLVWHAPGAGRLRLSLPAIETAQAPLRLHVRGAEATFLGVDGRTQNGSTIDLPPAGGVVTLRHDAGPVLAWVDRAVAPTSQAGTGSVWQGDSVWHDGGETPLPLTLPVVQPLARDAVAFRIEVEGPSLLHVRGAGPAVTEVVQAGRAPQIAVHGETMVVDADLDAGTATVFIRPLGGARDRSATVSLETTPIPWVGEGLGPAVLLAAGDARAFRFAVATERAVGVGVRADRDVVESTLLNAAGQVLGTGVVHMHTLVPGTYVLRLSVPANAPPIRARPAVVGLERPGTGPPEAVLRDYLGLGPAADPDGVTDSDATDGTRRNRPMNETPANEIEGDAR